jgi:pilus assembly protein CpaC
MRKIPYVILTGACLWLAATMGIYGQAPAVGQAQSAPAVGQLRMQTGRSLIINSPENLSRVSVSDPTIATAVIVSPMQVLINGIGPGTVTLILWDQMDRTQSYNLTVELDINALNQALSQTFPNEKITAVQSGNAVVLSGTVSGKDVSDRAAALVATQAKNVVNLLVAGENRQVVMLQVRFAEVDRSAIEQLGVNFFSTGAGNTIGAISTEQFAAPTLSTAGGGARTAFNLGDLLNIFVFRPDINLGATIKALETKNVLQILAEPNILALNGTEANFLAGGEFPFPVVQGTAGLQSVTIQFKEFGIRLGFTPTILDDGQIRLKVSPEVSALDFSNAVTLSGFTIPALSTRRANTQVQLRDGQSFAIAGLLDNRTTEVASKIPVLGDVPILGNLFKSKNENKARTELLVTVTPRLVRPLDPSVLPAGPEFPKPFLDKDRFDDRDDHRFDGKVGEAPAKQSSIAPSDATTQEARYIR